MTDVEALKDELRAGRERLLAAIAGVSEEQFKRRPTSPPNPHSASREGEQGWSIAEVLAHLLDLERMWTRRIAMALDAPEATVQPSDDAAHQAAARAGRVAPVPQLIHGLLAARRELGGLIDRAAAVEAGFERAVMHPRRGRLTVAWMVRTYGIEHEAEHTTQIEAIRKEMEGTSAPG